MSAEFRAIHNKRTSPDTPSSNPVPEDDHRKRRRNRTTQSCLNCHTSKRMCDRKRPCGRCTQLGLTGLCVYEVDDPSQRSGAHDESSRLRQRVAELEGVIRELKNKPHPRWAKSGSNPGEEFEKCHARAQFRSASEDSTEDPSRHQSDISHPLTIPDPVPSEVSAEKQIPCPVNETLRPSYLASSFSPRSMGNPVSLSVLPYSPHFDAVHSPPSAPSTGIATPTDEHPKMPIAVAGDQHLTNDIDLASLSMSYPDLMGGDEGTGHVDRVLCVNTHRQYVDTYSTKYRHAQFLNGHCGCLNEATSYNVVLELSLRLRKAADILSHAANHRFNNGCPLNRRIVDLDTFATTSLGNVTTSPNDFGPVHLRSRANAAPASPILPAFSAGSCVPPPRAPVLSPPSLRGLRSWNGVTCASEPFVSCEEPFMTYFMPGLLLPPSAWDYLSCSVALPFFPLVAGSGLA